MSGTEIITSIIEILVKGIEGIATGIGGGISSLVSNLFFSSGGSALSIFGTLVIVFAGISLALGLSRWVLNFITSLGERNR